MNLFMLEPGSDLESFDSESRKICGRLGSMSLTRLQASLDDGNSRADQAFAVAQELVDLTAELEGGKIRKIPVLPAFCVADVLAVAAYDFRAAIGAVGQDPAPTPSAGSHAWSVLSAQTLQRALELLTGLRRIL